MILMVNQGTMPEASDGIEYRRNTDTLVNQRIGTS